MKKVLVTGAQGFIGKKVSQYFIEKKYEVIGWDRHSMHNIIKIENINLLNQEDIENRLLEIKPDIIIHCAGSADVGKSVEYPEEDFLGNVVITHNLLFALHKCGMENVRIVFLSSAGVYGNPEKLPITENARLNPLSPYAVHKVMCEDLCQYFVNNYGANIKIARIFSAYGAGLKKQIFWDMYNKAKNTHKLNMLGTGNESRDYIHVNDVVQAIYLLATTETKKVIFNIANGKEVTIREAAEIFAKNLQIDCKDVSFNNIIREGDPLNWKADINRIQKLGYKQTVAMDDGIRDYCRWVSGEKENVETNKECIEKM